MMSSEWLRCQIVTGSRQETLSASDISFYSETKNPITKLAKWSLYLATAFTVALPEDGIVPYYLCVHSFDTSSAKVL